MASKLNQRQHFLLKLLMRNATKQVEKGVLKMHPADLAEIFYHLSRRDQTLFLEVLYRVRLAGPTLNELPDNMVYDLLEPIDASRLAQMCNRISDDDAVDLLQHLTDEKREEVLQLLDEKKRFTLFRLMLYPPDSAGGIMTTDVMAFNEEMTVEETVKLLRDQATGEELIYMYVLDSQKRLEGIVNARTLLLTSPEQKLKDILDPEVVSVEITMTQEEVSREVAKYNLLSIPVVDEERVFQGVITVDDVLDVMEEEATEDIYRLANLDTDEHANTPVFKSFTLRAPWLLLTLLTTGTAALVVSFFEETIRQYVTLAVLMPIVAGVSGNSGIQSLTVVVRGLALGEFQQNNGFIMTLKQVWVGLLNGLVVGLAMGVISYSFYGNEWLAGIVFGAIIISLTISGLLGAVIPLVLHRLKWDPALGSSVFITMIGDLGGFATFLGFATWLIQNLVQ